MRLRRNFASGVLGASVSASDTVLTSVGFAVLPEILGGSGDVLALTLDPAGSSPEVVHVTSHDVAAQTVSVVRGQETGDGAGAASAWASGTAWQHAPTVADFEYTTMPTRTVTGASDALAAGDAAGQVLFSSSSAVSVTVPSGVFVAGQAIVLRPIGAGQVTVSAGSGATMRAPNGAKSAGQWRPMVVTFIGGSEFVVDGDVTS